MSAVDTPIRGPQIEPSRTLVDTSGPSFVEKTMVVTQVLGVRGLTKEELYSSAYSSYMAATSSMSSSYLEAYSSYTSDPKNLGYGFFRSAYESYDSARISEYAA